MPARGTSITACGGTQRLIWLLRIASGPAGRLQRRFGPSEANWERHRSLSTPITSHDQPIWPAAGASIRLAVHAILPNDEAGHESLAGPQVRLKYASAEHIVPSGSVQSPCSSAVPALAVMV